MSRAEPNFILMAGDDEPSPVDQLRRRALRLLKAAESEAEERDEVRRDFPGFAAPAAFSPVRPAPARALAVGIVTMPAVFILVVMVALALFGKPASAPKADQIAAADVDTLEQPAARTAALPTFVSAQSSPAVAIGEDRRITGISLDGDRVAMQVESPMGTEIVIFDFVEGRIIASTPIVTSSAAVDDQLSSLIGAPPPGTLANLTIVVPSTGAPVAPEIKPRSAD